MDTVLTWFVRIWIVIGVGLNIAGLVMPSPAWKELALFQPLSLANLVAQVVIFSPAVLALVWREKRRAKARPAGAASYADFRAAERDALRPDTRPAERDDRARLQRDTRPPERDTRPAERDDRLRLRGDIRSAPADEQFERLFENIPPKRPL